jgi:hypothetical protein
MGPAAGPLGPLMVEITKGDPNWLGSVQRLQHALEQIGPAAKEALPYLRELQAAQPVPALRRQLEETINLIEQSK